MFRRLLPREVCFFTFFEEHAAVCIEVCEAFRDLTHGNGDRVDLAMSIKELEHRADDITHNCIEELNKTFITPIDRVDIHALMKQLDDIVDAVDATTSRLMLYELQDEIRPEAAQLAEILVKATVEIEAAVKCLRRISHVGAIKDNLIAVHRLENEGDTLLRAALARLFQEEDARPILVIKWKEIFERLERATDRCEEVANIIEKITIEAS